MISEIDMERGMIAIIDSGFQKQQIQGTKFDNEVRVRNLGSYSF